MSVTAAQGFAASGVAAGIRRSAPDVALVRSQVPAVGGAVWTTNRVLAAPVLVSQRHLGLAQPQAVVVNAGVANAATGEQGIADAERTAGEAASRRASSSASATWPRVSRPALVRAVSTCGGRSGSAVTGCRARKESS